MKSGWAAVCAYGRSRSVRTIRDWLLVVGVHDLCIPTLASHPLRTRTFPLAIDSLHGRRCDGRGNLRGTPKVLGVSCVARRRQACSSLRVVASASTQESQSVEGQLQQDIPAGEFTLIAHALYAISPSLAVAFPHATRFALVAQCMAMYCMASRFHRL